MRISILFPMVVVLAAASGWSLADAASPMPGQQGLQHFDFKTADGAPAKMAYWLYLPPVLEAKGSKGSQAKLPMVLFLHGSGERGTNPAVVKKHGPPKLVGTMKELDSLIVVSPQCPPEQWWDTKVLKALCDALIKSQPVDPDRIYLTGLSMGGFGSWSLLAEHPDFWAAAIPVCGGGDPRSAEKFKKVPIWIFHGAKDQAVPLKASQEMADALKAAGAEPKFTIYPEVGHECWGVAYGESETWKWLLQQRRNAAKK